MLAVESKAITDCRAEICGNVSLAATIRLDESYGLSGRCCVIFVHAFFLFLVLKCESNVQLGLMRIVHGLSSTCAELPRKLQMTLIAPQSRPVWSCYWSRTGHLVHLARHLLFALVDVAMSQTCEKCNIAVIDVTDTLQCRPHEAAPQPCMAQLRGGSRVTGRLSGTYSRV